MTTVWQGVPYLEMPAYKELGRLDGNESTRELICPWSQRLLFEQAMLGDAAMSVWGPGPSLDAAWIPSGKGGDHFIFRILPEVNPERPWQRCISLEGDPYGQLSRDQVSNLIHPLDPSAFFALEEADGAAIEGGDDLPAAAMLPTLQEGFAHYTATYASVNYPFNVADAAARVASGNVYGAPPVPPGPPNPAGPASPVREVVRFCNWRHTYHVENLQVPGGTFFWTRDGVPIPANGVLPFPHTEWTCTWMGVPGFVYATIASMMGCVNYFPFSINQYFPGFAKSFAADTLLFLTIDQTPIYRSPSGQLLADFSMKFAERDAFGATWEMLFRPQTGIFGTIRAALGFSHFEAAQDLAGNPIFPRRDFNQIFQVV